MKINFFNFLLIFVFGFMSCSKNVDNVPPVAPEETEDPVVYEFTYKGVKYSYLSDLSDANAELIRLLQQFEKNKSLAILNHVDGTLEYFDSYEDLANSFPILENSPKIRKSGYNASKISLAARFYSGNSLSNLRREYFLTPSVTSLSESYVIGDLCYSNFRSFRFQSASVYHEYMYMVSMFDETYYNGCSFSYVLSYVTDIVRADYLSSVPNYSGNWSDRIRSVKMYVIDMNP